MDHKSLASVPLFAGLTAGSLTQLAAICQEQTAAPHKQIITQNTTGEEVFIIFNGSVEVFIEGLEQERVLVVLGKGQVFGEMALIDQGYRSASVRAGKQGCALYLIHSQAFNALCQSNSHIGYIVMRNLARDLAFKLRHQNLAQM